jgi:hypothetical protein
MRNMRATAPLRKFAGSAACGIVGIDDRFFFIFSTL